MPSHFEAGNVAMLRARSATAKEAMMDSSRNLIIGAIAVIVVAVAAYFAVTAYNATPPQTPPGATTPPKS